MTALENLKNLFKNKAVFEINGPTTEEGQEWLANVSYNLNQAEPAVAREFDRLSQYTHLELSGYTMGPIISRMMSLIRRVITQLEHESSHSGERTYLPGDQYDVYKDLKKIISKTQSKILIVDPYANPEIFDLYVEKIKGGTTIRFLTKNPSKELTLVITKFIAKPKYSFEARQSTQIHDRMIFIDDNDCWVLGQSIKDAAVSKPTYLTQLQTFTDLKNCYEGIWNQAISIK